MLCPKFQEYRMKTPHSYCHSLLSNSVVSSILILAFCLLSTVAIAQVDRAVLEGTVSDQSGATITAAGVKVTDVETGISQEQKTNSNGYYLFPGLAVGRYAVTVTG